MKLLFAFLIALSILGYADSASCTCYQTQNVSSTVAAITIGAPTETGAFGSPPCGPVTCTTTITFTGPLNNTLSAGAQISVVQCANVSSDNTVTLGANNQTFSSCPSGVYKLPIDYTSTFAFTFKLVSPITFTVVLQPILQNPPTTTTPAIPTTPMYAGPFAFNPAISTIDLTIGLDTNSANEQYFNKSREAITNIVKYFTYSSDFVRLSFMTFDPYSAAGTGKYPLWTHNISTMSDNLNNMPFYPGNQSQYFSALETFFFKKLQDFPLRDNIERIFIIFTGTDCAFDNTNIGPVQTDIDRFDMKFIFVNMNTAITAVGSPLSVYPNCKGITGKGSNQQHWFDYQLNQNNAENILSSLYFDGNALCNAPSSSFTVQNPKDYSLPLVPSIYYCNYMNNVQTYNNPGSPTTALKVYFSAYDFSNEKDVIRIGINGTEVSVLTGRFGSAYYCLTGTPITVTFQSKNGAVYNGYNSTVTAFPDVTSCKASSSRDAKFIDISNRY